nr:hypothetical protein [uncultured Mucilaginibacter sp.]
MRRKLKLFLGISCLLFAGRAWSQSRGINPDTLQVKLALYAKINAAGLLFVHTDKTIYTNNEPIWFAGYLINSGLGSTDDHTIISVSLMREDDRKVVYEQQNVMQQGLGSGSLVIPDNVPPGNYLFNACTNVLDHRGKPIAIFSQSLTIKSITDRRFSATLALLDTVITNGKVRASVILNFKDEKRKGTPVITYSATGNKAEKISLSDKQSSANITLPASQLTGADPVLLTEIVYNYDTLYLNVKLPKVQSKGLNVRFFPEGGNLSDGLESTVAIETTTKAGLQVALKGVLYRGDKPIDTISTNSYGIGRFSLKPAKGNIYTFKVKANIYLNKDTLYVLPNILENGVVLHFNEAIVNDTLRMTLYSKAAKKVQVAIHNYNEAFSLFDTEARPDGKKLSLVLPTLPKGIATVTIMDDEGKPLAERIFFAHYNHSITATIKTHKPTYGKRDSVAVSINLKDHNGNPVSAILSVAAIQKNRIERIKQQDIESYVYLNHDLGNLPPDPMGRGFDNRPYLEDMFLTRGWRRYSWQSLMQSKATDTLSIGPSPIVKGNLIHYDKPLKKPRDIVVFRHTFIDKFSTEKDGSFILKQDQLEVEEGKKIRLWINLGDEKGYDLRIVNPFAEINSHIAEEAVIIPRGFAKSAESSTDQQLKGFEKSILLKEANIRADKKDESMFGYANACGDYICQFNILNCNNHKPWNSKVRPAVKGDVTTSGIYRGCTTNGQQVPPVFTAREFYGLNRDPDSSFEPQNLSTLLWKPGLVTNEKGEASFSFFTSDITGKYKIVVQGVGENNVVNGVGELTVK